MKNSLFLSRLVLRASAFLAIAFSFSPIASAQDFTPDLGLAAELIDGGNTGPIEAPAGSPEAMVYPMPAEQPKVLLTEVPGKKFKQVSPPPKSYAVWKVPFYLALGLPRDLVDGFFGFIRNIPIVSVANYVVYEKVPTQILLRDPRDWHNWWGDANRNNHGYYDGVAWGYFPSLHQWEFSRPSTRKARRNEAYNDKLYEELRLLNAAAEEHNQAIAARKLEARSEALKGIQNGDGSIAVRRMIPYLKAYPLDSEGAFALLATGLAMYAPDGPPWAGQMLWHRLNNAQPGPLAQTEALMENTLQTHPDLPVLNEALIYVKLLSGDSNGALRRAQAYLARKPGDPRRTRLAFETAMTARDVEIAKSMRDQLDTNSLPPWERQVLQARMQLIEGEVEPARQTLAALQAANPENAYLTYYLGSAELIKATSEGQSVPGFQLAIGHLELAALQGTAPSLRLRAGQSLGYARSIMAEAARQPEIFAATPTESPAP